MHLIETYFGGEAEESENLAPAVVTDVNTGDRTPFSLPPDVYVNRHTDITFILTLITHYLAPAVVTDANTGDKEHPSVYCYMLTVILT